tara:strand:+ start:4123 stop:4746 length:624 start_codon:yes stop_codon:yes gene_type:complete
MAVVPVKAFVKKGFLEKTIRNAPQVAAVVDKVFRRRVIGLKGAALKEFDNHPVTKELKQGPSGINVSGTLGGIGNLFSFIGFYSGDRPTDEVREKLKGYLDVVGVQRKIRGNRGVSSYRYSLTFPTISSFDSVSQMPWESGNSWVRGVENGISGFSNYMYLNYGEGRLERSRSGTAVQTKKNVNVGIFRPTKYITEILDNYRKRLAQ